MISVLRNTSVACLLVVSCPWGVASLLVGERHQYPTTTHGETTRPVFDDVSVADKDVPGSPYLASKYHLRNRGTRSFHLATDSDREYESRRDAKTGAVATPSENIYLAARYHLRNRTARFFERAAGAGQKSKSRHNSTGKPRVPATTEQEGRQLA